ncbi:unnamed protein product [Hyaloperonospora brassicae]|uniref:AB hydrolase-1 domain-containing protein n=1 Tax=Hyaloperonospora brassicae TaxID=162125 RepID=A0AAV0TLC2_HYABA|nr:unnamed protein product [Hyaloperonospora brassicae]
MTPPAETHTDPSRATPPDADVSMLTPQDCQCGNAHEDETIGPDDDTEERKEQNPVPVLLAFVAMNTVFVTLGGLIRFLAHLLTLPGLLVALLLGTVLAVRRVALLMTYPGQLKLVIREGEATFARLTKQRLQVFTEAALELVAVLDPLSSNRPTRLRFLQVHQSFTFALETMALPVMESLEIVERDGQLGLNGETLLSALQDIVTLNSQRLSEPCSKLCSASEKTFELQRCKMFTEQKVAESLSVEALEKSPSKLFGDVPNTVRQQSTIIDLASQVVETAVQSTCAEAVNPLVAFATAVRRLQTAITLIGRLKTDAPAASRNVAWIARELCRGSSPEVDCIATLELLRADMIVRFKAEQMWIPGHQGHQIDAMLMPPASRGRDAVARPVVMLCNPNGGLYEFHHLHMDWIRFYTAHLDCHVLVYNYRGYGRCKGSPSPAMHNFDGLAIVSYLKTERGFGQIAVHGESLGGLVATYVASMSPHVNVLIADRTFATVPALAQRMIARWAGTLVDWVMRWDTDNVQKYLDATCAKLLCSDPSDEIILDGASLKSGVALRLELNDKTFDLPRQPIPGGSLTSPVPPANIMSKIGMCSLRSSRPVSEAASRPLMGQPLTDSMVIRFSEAVLSVGGRALECATGRGNEQAGGHRSDALEESETSGNTSDAVVGFSDVAIVVDDAEAAKSEEHAAISETQPMLPADEVEAPVPVASTAGFPGELLPVIWMQLARLDGYCGQVLLQAAENGGHDKIRAWTASLLTWGGHVAPERRKERTLEPFERNGILIVPITIAEVHAVLQHLAEQHPSLKYDYDIGFVMLMVEYLNDALQRRWRHLDTSTSEERGVESEAVQNDKKTDTRAAAEQRKTIIPLLINTEDARLGCLLPLHCGHNKNFQDAEKQALAGFLRQAGFIGPVT